MPFPELQKENTPNPKANGWLTIDLGALARNYHLVDQKTGNACKTACVVKADAYGLGLKEIVQRLKAEGCQNFYVAGLQEGLRLREIDQKIKINIFNGFYKEYEQDYLQNNLIPVLNSLEEIKDWKNIRTGAPCAVHFDTGMNRLGLNKQETQKFFEDPALSKDLNIKTVLSHFACADEDGNEMTEMQYQRFLEITRYFPEAKKSLSNSFGAFRNASYHFDEIRPGISLYGGNPMPGHQNPMELVVHLFTRILTIHNAKAGETVGYGATHKFEKDTTLATLALGYADGFFRHLGNNSKVYWKNQACPVIGRVSMDLITVDIGHILGHIQGEKPKPGDSMEILGHHQTIDDLAQAAGTIPYEIITSLGNRYERIYV